MFQIAFINLICLIALELQLSGLKVLQSSSGCQWLTPVIVATQEAEIRRIVVQSQPRQIV
jgi:hypothetical protein